MPMRGIEGDFGRVSISQIFEVFVNHPHGSASMAMPAMPLVFLPLTLTLPPPPPPPRSVTPLGEFLWKSFRSIHQAKSQLLVGQSQLERLQSLGNG